MAFEVVQDDILKMTTDAIVNTIKANVEVGEVTYTKWDSASTRYVIHTTIPTWQDGEKNEEEDLHSCFRNILELAKKLNCRSIAVPLMCIGKNSMPPKLVLEIAVSEVKAFLEQNEMMIYLAIQDDEAYQLAKDYVAKYF